MQLVGGFYQLQVDDQKIILLPWKQKFVIFFVFIPEGTALCFNDNIT